jgi:AbrB family looped-hinge helix DNA binding protein
MVVVTAKVKMDRAGRIVLPKAVREELGLAPGEELALETLDDQITLRLIRGTAQLRKKRGVWVADFGEPLSASTVEKTINRIRQQRDREILG